MAIDATGPASTKFAIPKYNTSGDAPSGKGLNNIIDSLDTILSNLGISSLVANDVPVYDSVAGKWKKATGTPSVATFFRGDGWVTGGVSLIATATPVAATVSFTSIPASFKHLLILWTGSNNGATEAGLNMTLNGDAGANYNWGSIESVNGVATASNGSAATSMLVGIVGTSGSVMNGSVFFPNYLSALTGKGGYGLYAGSAVAIRTGLLGGRWTGTVAINRIDLSANGGAFLTGSLFSLYGIGG